MGLDDFVDSLGLNATFAAADTPRSMPSDLYFNGLHGTAVIRGMQGTNVGFGADFGAEFSAGQVVTFELLVSATGRPDYALSTNQAVPHLLIGAIRPGKTVDVRIDPANFGRLAIDFNQMLHGGGEFPRGRVTADQVCETGEPGSAVVHRVFKTWQAVLNLGGDPIRGVVMIVSWPGKPPFVSRNGQRVPRDKLKLLVPGATFPVKGDPNIPDLAVIDWSAIG
ncbi:hypothetical protein [Subtercola lobariae]|uniref:Uncharacterized protein n=1 Tax=Subtercola lobariae TaxID=1588641 RepID=A0A917BE16_9MICO|nr:hypothetical protein [Subtercola lobariae]GGF38964.1 hypothetical protein GCM10011399_34800 [Subtercola lobariae]